MARRVLRRDYLTPSGKREPQLRGPPVGGYFRRSGDHKAPRSAEAGPALPNLSDTPRQLAAPQPPPRPAAPIGPLPPPRQHLPRPPPGRPAACPQPLPPSAPARRARPAGAPRGESRGRGSPSPPLQRGVAQTDPRAPPRETSAPPLPSSPVTSPPGASHSQRPQPPLPRARTVGGGRGERRRGGAEALRPAPKAQPPGRGREVRRRGRRACVRPIPIATRRLRVRGGGTTRMLVGHAQPFSLPRWRPAPRPCTQHRLRCGPTRGKAGPGARWRRPRGRAAGGGERFREAGGGRGPWPGPGPAAGRVPLPPTRWRQQRDGLRGRNV